MFDKIKRLIFGYDIFISYSRFDSLDYAYAIARHFMAKGYSCYIDQLSSVIPGDEISENIKDAVKRSTAFVLIGSEGAQPSAPIKEEISLFLENNRNKPLIPLTIGGGINAEAIWYDDIKGLALIDDTQASLKAGQPAADVLERIENALKFTRKSIQLRNTSLAVLAGVGLVILVATYFTYEKTQQAKQADQEKRQALALRDRAEKDLQSSITAKAEAERQTAIANREKRQADSLKTIAFREKNAAEKNVERLSLQGTILKYRQAAMRFIENDPVKAYRFAEKAYRMDRSQANKEVLLASTSSIDYYYKLLLEDYQIVDFKEPYILLLKKNAQENGPNLKVYEMRTSSIVPTSIHADYAWIIPNENSWKILTRNWLGSGMGAIPEYQLWNNQSQPIGNKIQEGGLEIAKFINPHKVSIALYKQSKTLVWDLNSGEKKYIDVKADDFMYNYRLLDVRSDGVAAVPYYRGLALLNTEANVDTVTHTNVDFDSSPFFSKAKWSPDDKYLALNYFDQKRLGIWNPNNRSFVWLDPSGWVVNAHCWSQNGHILAFSGRTENQTNVTVEVVDASSPENTREIVYQGEIPIQNIAFLPDDKNIAICDKESNMYIIEIASKKVIGKGQQADLINSSSLGFYSSSTKDFKSWSTTPNFSKFWHFKSDSTRTYQPEGAADPQNKWLAVPYLQKTDTTMGVEMRNIISGEKKIFGFSPDYVHGIAFSNDGNWLITQTSGNIYFWNLVSSQKFEFPLFENDKQFINFRIDAKKVYAFIAQGLESSNNEIIYVFNINKHGVRFSKRMVEKKQDNTAESYGSAPYRDAPASVEGWKMDNLYKYRASGWIQSRDWAVRLSVRDNPLGAKDGDVLFVPTNMSWLMDTYNSLLWNPSETQLRKLMEEK